MLGLTVVGFLCGFTPIIGLFGSCSAYGRVVMHISEPICMLGNNLLESLFVRFDNYTSYQVDTSILSISSLLIAIITFAAIFVMAWKYGRIQCSTICPVGIILGLSSRFSLFKARIDTTKCNGCGLCATKCKTVCIDSKKRAIDYSRCVDCFNCLGVCKQKALVYAPSLKKQSNVETSAPSLPDLDSSKRRSLIAGLVAVGATPKLISQAKESVASLEGKKAYKRENPVIPPGSIGREHFQQQCTSCHFCVDKCPSHILKPVFMEYDSADMVQPTISFEKGLCNFDCIVYGDVCSNGAALPISVEQKHLTQVEHAILIEENCIVYTDGTSCGACSEHCPTQAVVTMPYEDGLTIPHVNREIYVGRGGCEYAYPACPFRVIYIEGNSVQKEAKLSREGEGHEVEIDDFGF